MNHEVLAATLVVGNLCKTIQSRSEQKFWVSAPVCYLNNGIPRTSHGKCYFSPMKVILKFISDRLALVFLYKDTVV